MPGSRSACVMLLTGFEPFGNLRRNPSEDVVRRLRRDASLRRLGLRTGILPVHRRGAPEHLDRLLARLRPRILLMTGVAAGRPGLSVERLAINCYRRPADRGQGRPIDPDGPDGLFATIPLEPAVEALARKGAAAAISESAGTFTCNLVLYHALNRARVGAAHSPGVIGFIHLPATPEALPRGDGRPAMPLDALAAALGRLVRRLLEDSPEG